MISPSNPIALASVSNDRSILGRQLLDKTSQPSSAADEQVQNAKATREAFTKFVGTTVFGQMLSSMRKTVGEPAYFHGGQAEKVFQGQLDQAIADHLTESDGSSFADALFNHQFPHLAELLSEDAAAEHGGERRGDLDQLAALRRF